MRRLCVTLAAAALTALAAQPVNAQQNMENVLNEKQQAVVAISCLEAKGDIEGLRKAIGEGLDAGLTVSQVKEALSQLYAYTGFPRSLNALGALQGVLDERKAQGVTDDEGRAASPMAPGYDADVVLVDLEHPYTVSREKLHSKSKNCPYDGAELYGRVCATIKGGQLTYRAED